MLGAELARPIAARFLCDDAAMWMRVRRALTRARWLLALLVTVGCSRGADDGAVSCDEVATCDIREPRCQRLAIAVAGCLRGDDPDGLDVDIMVVDFETLLAEQTEGTEGSVVPVSEQTFRTALATLGLSTPVVTAEGDIEDSLEAIAAFYWQGGVVIIDRGEPLDDASAFEVLTHEIVHALQDLAGDFESEAQATSFDVWLARRAIAEGEATILGIRGGLAAAGRAEEAFDFAAFFAELQTSMSKRTLTSDDPWLDARIAFPYAWGGAYVLAAEQQGGRAAISALYGAREPESTRQVLVLGLTEDRAGEAWRDPLGKDAVPILVDEATSLQATSSLGAWLVKALEMRKDLDLDFSVAERLRGDSLTAFSFDDVAGEPASLLVWRLRLSSNEEAERLAAVRTFGANVLLHQDASDVWITARSSGTTLAEEVQGWAKQEGGDFFFGQAGFGQLDCAFGREGPSRPLSRSLTK
jgi:hypothetical protein